MAYLMTKEEMAAGLRVATGAALVRAGVTHADTLGGTIVEGVFELLQLGGWYPAVTGATDTAETYSDVLRKAFDATILHPRPVVAIGQLEDLLRGLLRGEHSSLHLSFNDHAANYLDATKERADGDLPDDEWVSESERDKALGVNQVWTLQWYPDTPVGCHIMRASSLSALLSWVAENGRTA